MVLDWLADRFALERFTIGRLGDTYMTRWTLFGRRMEPTWHDRAVYLHRIHRSDGDDALHDHPWPFVSVILGGGYWEHTATATGDIVRRWYGPGRVLYRPARWRHRVELPAGRSCYSMVFRGPKQKSWSFFCLLGSRLTGREVPWRSFMDNVEAGALGCGEPA